MADLFTSVTSATSRAARASLLADAVTAADHRRRWPGRYRVTLLAADILAIGLAVVVGSYIRFESMPSIDYYLYGVLLGIGWIVALQNSGGYDIRHLATGVVEAKAVMRGSAVAVSVLAVYCYATRTEVARGFVVQVIPIGILLLFAARSGVRHFVDRQRRHGHWTHRILAVGTTESVRDLIEVTARAPRAGLTVVGVCVEDTAVGEKVHGVPVVGGVTNAAHTAAQQDADVVAVAGSGLGPRSVRELGWALEGTGRGLVLAPGLTEIAGPRVRVSPVEGLPLVWVEQPKLGRWHQSVKRAMDISGGLVMALLALPIVAVAAVLIRLDSPGPIFFRQRRLGVGGAEFTILKLRTMVADAESKREEILGLNESDGGGVLFKIREDPRITRVGRVLRKYSIDELPQALNVLSGAMALVGPRPLASEDSTYTGHARRRLMVRPGLTGLWQVSGRSNLSWDDAVRLDLFYVENWSIASDVSIMARTVMAVLRRKGAF